MQVYRSLKADASKITQDEYNRERETISVCKSIIKNF